MTVISNTLSTYETKVSHLLARARTLVSILETEEHFGDEPTAREPEAKIDGATEMIEKLILMFTEEAEAGPGPTVTATEFRELLNTVGYSQKEFALVMDVQPSTVNRWATDKLPVPKYASAYLRECEQYIREGGSAETLRKRTLQRAHM
jgi:DNA-binding transcriptional regulator YiaG